MATTENFRADVRYAAAPAAVYDALAAPGGSNGWWTSDGDVVSDSGQDIRLNWSGQDHVVFRVDMAERPTAMRWTCIAQYDRNLPQADEWVDTTLVFTLSADGQGTRLEFEHHGLTSALECYGVCREGWDYFLRRSVRQLAEGGRGLPYQARS
ncbi:MAG: hypothetical protein QOH62_2801 [Solirubrobacteraceae bacterium]|jgi:uncharacterized protein YndB with AHSA1/START domain|nr:hypothetical protein [Solirubrobacteraceae bacterium]